MGLTHWFKRLMGADVRLSAKSLLARVRELECQVELLAGHVQDRERALHDVLSQMPVGVVLVSADARILPLHAACLEGLFQMSGVSGKTLGESLLANGSLSHASLEQLAQSIEACVGQDEALEPMAAMSWPSAFERVLPNGDRQQLALSWSPVYDAQSKLSQIMLVVQDVSQPLAAEASTQALQQQLAMIAEVQPVTQEKFGDFIDTAFRLLDLNQVILSTASAWGADTHAVLHRNVRTIVDGAMHLGLLKLGGVAGEVAQAFAAVAPSGVIGPHAQELLRRLEGLRDHLARYAHTNEVVLGRKGPGRRGSVERYVMVERDQVMASLHLLASVDPQDVVAMRSALNQVGLTLNLVGTERLEDILVNVLDALPLMAREFGVEPPVVQINDQRIVVRNQISAMLKTVLSHVFRNSVEHGLETAAERDLLGKSAVGKITINVALDDNRLWINVRDDGRGLPVARLRQVVLMRELMAARQAEQAQVVAASIFTPGVSTASRAGDTRARGLGLDAVRGLLEKEGGAIAVHFLDERHEAECRPFELIISLPAKYAAAVDLQRPFSLKPRLKPEAQA